MEILKDYRFRDFTHAVPNISLSKEHDDLPNFCSGVDGQHLSIEDWPVCHQQVYMQRHVILAVDIILL